MQEYKKTGQMITQTTDLPIKGKKTKRMVEKIARAKLKKKLEKEVKELDSETAAYEASKKFYW